MENNLEDILVDNIEEKTPSKPKLRLIIIAVASIVLLAVLGTLAYVLLKGEPKKNPEFNNTELEKIIPQEPQSDDFDKLIAEIKNKDSLNQSQNPVSAETTLPPTQAQETSKIEEKKPAPKPEKKPIVESKPKSAAKTESKSPKQDSPTNVAETKQDKKKKQEEKKAVQNKSEKNAPSASKAFESVQNNTAPKGFYLQVGVFSGKPQADFISKLSSFQYKTETLQKAGKVLTRYLVGPYSNRDQAETMIFNIVQTMNIKPIIIEIK